jgi:hypothetical protein
MDLDLGLDLRLQSIPFFGIFKHMTIYSLIQHRKVEAQYWLNLRPHVRTVGKNHRKTHAYMYIMEYFGFQTNSSFSISGVPYYQQNKTNR